MRESDLLTRVNYWAGRLRIPHDFVVSIAEEDSDAYACVGSEGSWAAHVTFFPSFADLDRAKQDAVIIHELCHVLHFPLDSVFNSIATKQTRAVYRELLEIYTDALERAFVGVLCGE